MPPELQNIIDQIMERIQVLSADLSAKFADNASGSVTGLFDTLYGSTADNLERITSGNSSEVQVGSSGSSMGPSGSSLAGKTFSFSSRD